MKRLELSSADPISVARWDAALRIGRPVSWSGPVPHGWHAAEVGPLAESLDPKIRQFRPPDRSEDGPPVTVVIPCHRHVPWGGRALVRQAWSTQVLIVSNGAGPLSVPGARVWRTRWTGHADTRRRALMQVETPYVLMMSDDAVPLGRGFIGRLVAELERSDADAAVARQVPWPSAELRVRAAIRSWTPPQASVMPHADHVATLYRTETLRTLCTADVPIAEDMVWTRDRHVVLASEAPVLHSHVASLGAAFERRVQEHSVRARYGVTTPVPGIRAGLRALPGTVVGSSGMADLAHRVVDLAGMALGAHRGRRAG